MQIQDKVVIVTGASSGIGLATARLLTEKGAKIALVARSRDKLSQIEKGLRSSFAIAADVSVEEQVKEMVEKAEEHYGRVDVLVNNAGRGYDAPVEKIDTKTYMDIFKTNVIGPVVAMQQVIPIMRSQGGGAIVNITSGTALMFLPGMSPYSSLKRALIGISLTARGELEQDHIAVSLVYPYITTTDFEKNTIKHGSFGQPSNADDGEDLFQPPDPPEYVAGKILEAIETGEAEVLAHDWMKEIR